MIIGEVRILKVEIQEQGLRGGPSLQKSGDLLLEDGKGEGNTPGRGKGGYRRCGSIRAS
jgi:hypothetical protein